MAHLKLDILFRGRGQVILAGVVEQEISSRLEIFPFLVFICSTSYTSKCFFLMSSTTP